MKLKSVISILFLSIGVICFTQEITITDHNGKKLHSPEGLFLQVRVDKDSTTTFMLSSDKINVTRDSCDSIADIIVGGDYIQMYHNQYLPKQFKSLDTIRVFNNRYIAHPFPIFLIDMQQAIDSLLFYELDFATTLKQIDLPYTLSFNVFHADKVRKCEKKYISKAKKKYCEHLGIDNDKIKLIYEDKPYTTNQFDFFTSGTEVTRNFINSQNTPWMKGQAENYKLVMWVMINWTKE
ncbi:MAG: hypothetical protein V4622_09680 [Bacteroidota bacterium]